MFVEGAGRAFPGLGAAGNGWGGEGPRWRGARCGGLGSGPCVGSSGVQCRNLGYRKWGRKSLGSRSDFRSSKARRRTQGWRGARCRGLGWRGVRCRGLEWREARCRGLGCWGLGSGLDSGFTGVWSVGLGSRGVGWVDSCAARRGARGGAGVRVAAEHLEVSFPRVHHHLALTAAAAAAVIVAAPPVHVVGLHGAAVLLPLPPLQGLPHGFPQLLVGPDAPLAAQGPPPRLAHAILSPPAPTVSLAPVLPPPRPQPQPWPPRGRTQVALEATFRHCCPEQI